MEIPVKIFLFAALLAMSGMGAGQAQTPPANDITPANVGEAIAQVRSIADGEMRREALERITFVLRRNSSHIVERDVMALAAFMSDPDDRVRQWAALALGQIGPRASAAVPALQAAIPAVDCVWAGKNSRSGIIFALRRIGVEPILADCPLLIRPFLPTRLR
jgi:HEAT repeat protein